MFYISDTKGLKAAARLLTSHYIFKACRFSSIVLAPIYNVAWGPVSAAETVIMIYTTSYSKLVDLVRLHAGWSIVTSIGMLTSLSSKHSTHRRWLCSGARTRRFVPQYVPTCGLWKKQSTLATSHSTCIITFVSETLSLNANTKLFCVTSARLQVSPIILVFQRTTLTRNSWFVL